MSFSASLSGMYANQQKLDVIGNNLANINTIGFKASNINFAALVSASSDPRQVGLGVTPGAITPNFRQGGVENTGIPTNVAIQGSGFFVIGDGADRSYSRAGDFSFDARGLLVNTAGQPVQGFTQMDPVTGAIITTGQPSSIVVPPGVLRAPIATTTFGSNSNLDAGAAATDTFTASAQIFDALGTPHVATVTYTNTAAGAWNYSVAVPGEDVSGGTTGTPTVLKTGTVRFGPAGTLTQVDGAAPADITITGPTWADGATATTLTLSMLDANGNPLLTGYASPSVTSSVTQNGSGAGSVSSISIDGNGRINATIGAGQIVVLAQLAIANFNNPQGLVRGPNNGFNETPSSGIASIDVAGLGGRGTLVGSSLEQSNVDMAQEFTQMILAQRGYQANSKSITTADQLLVETLNLKQ